MLSTIAEIQKGQGLGTGYKWLAGLVSRVCMAGLVFRVCMGVRISRDRSHDIRHYISSLRALQATCVQESDLCECQPWH